MEVPQVLDLFLVSCKQPKLRMYEALASIVKMLLLKEDSMTPERAEPAQKKMTSTVTEKLMQKLHR